MDAGSDVETAGLCRQASRSPRQWPDGHAGRRILRHEAWLLLSSDSGARRQRRWSSLQWRLAEARVRMTLPTSAAARRVAAAIEAKKADGQPRPPRGGRVCPRRPFRKGKTDLHVPGRPTRPAGCRSGRKCIRGNSSCRTRGGAPREAGGEVTEHARSSTPATVVPRTPAETGVWQGRHYRGASVRTPRLGCPARLISLNLYDPGPGKRAGRGGGFGLETARWRRTEPPTASRPEKSRIPKAESVEYFPLWTARRSPVPGRNTGRG
jgi:hypothetical protein